MSHSRPVKTRLGRVNVLIGGRGADALTGGRDEDILIGGFTLYDADVAALQAIGAEWTSDAPVATRVGHLRGAIPGGRNGPIYLTTGPIVVEQALPDPATVFA